MANIIGLPQQPHHDLQGSRRTDLVVRAICLVDEVCLYGKVLISVNKLQSCFEETWNSIRCI